MKRCPVGRTSSPSKSSSSTDWKSVVRIRAVLAACLVQFAAAVALAQQPTSTPADPHTSPELQPIRQAVQDFVERYNAHQAEGVAALFAPDAGMVYRDGTEVNGREEIKQSFDDAFASSPKIAMSVVVDSIRLLTPDVAVEEGTTSLFPDGDTLTSQGRYTVLHLKRNNRWMMQSVRVVEEETLSAYGELQRLEWLVGEWLDEGRDEDVKATFRWDENKSFLLEEFQVIRQGEVVLRGTQRIGWDPQAKQIRSWIFDSAGGFGEATWIPAGDDWICKARGIQPSGTAASATRRLTRIAPERVLWMSTDRLLGDEVLPDLVVTMVRTPPKPQ